jgi:hypothetical protein
LKQCQAKQKCFGSGFIDSDRDPAFKKKAKYQSGSRASMTKKFEKISTEKKFDIVLIENWISVIPSPLYRPGLSCRKSLQPSKENI